jgi:hypothetical protein
MKIEEFPLMTGAEVVTEHPVFDSYDWRAVLDEADTASPVRCEDASTIPAEPTRMFTPEDVLAVDCWYAESPEGYGSVSCWGILRLKDGTWAACIAWADTTGWGCGDGVLWRLLPSREEAIVFGLDEEGRQRLGLELPEGPA